MFFLKDKNKDNTSVEIIVRFRGKRYKYPTGESVVVNSWLSGKHRCTEGRSYPEGADINLRLNTWEKHVKKVLNDFAMNFMVPTQDEFREALRVAAFGNSEHVNVKDGFVDSAKTFKKSCDRAKGTKKAYQTTINWLEKFEEKFGKLKFSDIDDQFYVKFKTFVYESEKINSPNTFGTLIKNIKVFMDHSVTSQTGHRSPGFKKIEAEADNIYLTVDELVKIHRIKIDEKFIREQFPVIKINNVNQKIKALELTRGKFLTGAFTALRVSDFGRIESFNITDMIRIRTNKGDKPVVIPVHWVVREILDSGFDLSTKISDQKINKQIKLLCRYADIKESVTLTTFKAGKRIDIAKDKCDWVTTHTARRSGATNMYKAGIPSISIMKITGHRTEKSFLKYIKINQEENAQLLAGHEFFKKRSEAT